MADANDRPVPEANWAVGLPLNVYSTLLDVPNPGFATVSFSRRDRRNSDLAEHLNGFAGFVTQDGRMDQRRYRLVRHILGSQVNLSLTITAAMQAAFGRWMAGINAVCFLPDMTVRSADGRVIFSLDPDEVDDTTDVPRPADALERKAANDSVLLTRGFSPLPVLPPVIGEGEADLRPAQEVALRLYALTAVAARGEALVNGPPLSARELQVRLPLAFSALSPLEKKLMSDGGILGMGAKPDRQTATQAAWRYEAVATLLWALGVNADLPFPDILCDAGTVVRQVLALPGDAFVQGARLRPTDEILDELDRIYRLHWITTEARSKGLRPTEGVDGGVVLERHYTLNWLTRFEDADWDDVTTPT